MSALNAKLAAALASRDARNIRRRLPDPSSAASPPYTDFSSNDYLSLAASPLLRARLLAALAAAPDALGSGGSRLLVNGAQHTALEDRLRTFFAADAALLFNSGFDANAGFFACVPQPGDILLADEHIHASVHDGARASRLPPPARRTFAHNDLRALRTELLRARADLPAGASVFVAVESVYSMDGTLAPLADIVHITETLFPHRNALLVVDEAHATGIYGPCGRGLVASLRLERRVFARLHTFGKALASSGAVVLTSPLVRDYLLNFARPLIYTTALANTSIVAASCAFDLLQDGTASALAETLHAITAYLLSRLRTALARIPPHILRLPPHLSSPTTKQTPAQTHPPAPIVPLLTPLARPLSAHLRTRGMNARPISWPTVPKGADRVRVCVQARTSRADVDRLVEALSVWAEGVVRAEGQALGVECKL
ncbi:pyridoxal phosphate-dependent transferase [Vararia minispora EC-137]|uniref:Pyridoxal phosphate-dependent transferase n=1 Tax=Vararia minispora EC-137 TaxID=1314806 RepID=A0ACB8Q4D3_9AGAM|nr:pyridoxal phosphate-dependent transferase [Vararia minispora EC-137]